MLIKLIYSFLAHDFKFVTIYILRIILRNHIKSLKNIYFYSSILHFKIREIILINYKFNIVIKQENSPL